MKVELILNGRAAALDVRTDEMLLEALRCAFNENHAFQCGWCTPGFILTAKAIRPGDDIREALGGNLCRCGCYVKIEEAVRACVS
jgi:aerobic-type carbon monoxide dehydrogenase small subunit (CoxS/CutS family)